MDHAYPGHTEEKKIRTGILGGNFNPVHNGHLNIARRAYQQFDLHEVWFMPAWIQPLKQGQEAAPACHRKRMVELAVQDSPHFTLCDYELKKKGVSYTCETLRSFRDMYPDRDFFFIMGADSVFTFNTWKNPGEICDCATLLVAGRHQENMADEQLFERAEHLRRMYGARIFFIDSPFYDISSTVIRSLQESGTATGEYLPLEVARYIAEQKLYRQK